MKKYKFSFVALMLVLILALAACSSDGESEANSSDAKKELQVAYNAQPPTLDPLITTAVATRDVMRNVYETLLTLKSRIISFTSGRNNLTTTSSLSLLKIALCTCPIDAAAIGFISK